MNFMYAILLVVCAALILLVLLQAGKGAGAGLSIGGGMSQTMFGGSGGRGFFIKLTTALAAAFFIICLVMGRMASQNAGQYKGLMSGAASNAPVAPPAPSQPSAAQPAAESKPVAAQPIAAAKPVAPAPAAPKK